MWLDTLVSVCTWAWAFDLCGQAITSRPSIVLAVVMTHGIPKGEQPHAATAVYVGASGFAKSRADACVHAMRTEAQSDVDGCVHLHTPVPLSRSCPCETRRSQSWP